MSFQKWSSLDGATAWVFLNNFGSSFKTPRNLGISTRSFDGQLLENSSYRMHSQGPNDRVHARVLNFLSRWVDLRVDTTVANKSDKCSIVRTQDRMEDPIINDFVTQVMFPTASIVIHRFSEISDHVASEDFAASRSVTQMIKRRYTSSWVVWPSTFYFSADHRCALVQ